MRLRNLLILLLILASLVPAYLFDRYAKRAIGPRRSFGHLLFYFLVIFAFIVGYTFLLVWGISKIFPVQGVAN